jgi:hypothetical protein
MRLWVEQQQVACPDLQESRRVRNQSAFLRALFQRVFEKSLIDSAGGDGGEGG